RYQTHYDAAAEQESPQKLSEKVKGFYERWSTKLSAEYYEAKEPATSQAVQSQAVQSQAVQSQVAQSQVVQSQVVQSQAVQSHAAAPVASPSVASPPPARISSTDLR
ncbi:unnamed protein product, partial [marine sediment metagenome]